MDSYASSAAFVASDVEDFAADAVPAEKPFVDPRRPALKYRPLKAWHHFRELLKDKENTEEVFHIFEALPWKGLQPAAQAFLETDLGKRLQVTEPNLVPILDDHASLRRLPAGSVAHAYCDFMEREGLTAQGLIDEYEKFRGERPQFGDRLEWYYSRMRDTHDLLHVLTGYGRDALGEACVLAFTYSQQPSHAHLFISYMAGLNMRKQSKARFGVTPPVLKAIREGQKLGRACPRIVEQSIRELLAMPLDATRAKLNITPARWYHEAHAAWRAAGADPYDLLAEPMKKAA